MKRDEILSEFKKGVRARKYNRHYINPDKESETMIGPRTPPKKKDDIKEATGDPVGKITKVDPSTKQATITKPDGTTQQVDPTSLKPTPDGKMQMDAPDSADLTNKDVVSTEDALAPPGDSQSPIHGDEEHPGISQLLVQRLKKLAGLEQEQATAFGGVSQNTDDNTGDVTTSYNVGPMSISHTKNAQGQTIGSKGSYKIANGQVNVDNEYRDGEKTISTLTGTGDVDHLTGVGASAERKRVDPAKFAQFQRNLPTRESPELESMLRIAKLR